MANEEHLRILKQGVEQWNDWREQNREITPDLSWADLSWTGLREANLSSTNLHGANLRGADLREADFSEANLIWADLRGADLQKSIFWVTIFGGTHLQKARNLDSCQHFGESIVDQMTLINSRRLPEAFLKGCGLSDEFIQQIPFLFWDKAAFEFYSSFISYSNKDEDFAKRLHADLQSEGVRCWFAPEDMKIGEKFRQRIDETIRLYDKLLLILSENSINSAWVEKEVETAFEKENRNKHTVLFPIRLDDGVMDTGTAWAADIRRTRHIGNFTNWKDHDAYKKAFERLMRDLKAS